MELKLHCFLTAVLHGSNGSDSYPGPLPTGKWSLHALVSGSVSLRADPNTLEKGKSSVPVENRIPLSWSTGRSYVDFSK